MYIKRRYLQVSPPPDSSKDISPQSLEFYDDRKVVVILGGPGIGKTTEFDQFSKRHETSPCRLVTVSQFLAFPDSQFQDCILYLDALDEYRADTSGGHTVLDKITGKLLSLASPKVRLSCREMEWHSGSDLSSLSNAGAGEDVIALKMLPLDEKEIAGYVRWKLEDEDLINAFMDGAEERDLLSILGTPENLNRYLEVFQSKGQWPSSRLELMEASTVLLLEELNAKHERAYGEKFCTQTLRELAEDLSAILALGDKEGISLSAAACGPLEIALKELPCLNISAAGQVARRRIFASKAPEKIQAQHKTTGDFLCAKALVRRVKDYTLTFSRVQSLICGPDGGPFSHLRDVYAWVIALLPQYALRMMQADPYAALIYGDVAQWPVVHKRKVLAILKEYAAHKDPWFRAEMWQAPLLGGLACAELVPDFLEILEKEENGHVVSVILHALEYGQPLPEMAETLWQFIYQARLPYLSSDALKVHQQLCPEAQKDRKGLLDDVISGRVTDVNDSLRQNILEELYPQLIGPQDIVPYLVPYQRDEVIRLDWFVEYNLLELTPIALLKDLASSLIEQRDVLKGVKDFDRRKLNGNLMTRLLTEFGTTATAAEFYQWQEIYCDRYFHAYLDKDAHQEINEFFDANPTRYQEIFCHWLEITKPDEKHNFRWYWHEFYHRMLAHVPPRTFPRFVLGLIKEEQRPEAIDFLYGHALGLVLQSDEGTFDLTFEELYDFKCVNPELEEVWQQETYLELQDWKLEQNIREVNRRKGQALERKEDVRVLIPMLDELRAGQQVRNLNFGANLWFSSGEDKDNPYGNIVEKTNEAIADAMLVGFDTLLKTASPYTVEEIVNTYCDRKRYWETFPVLVGADIVAKISLDNLAGLPTSNLEALFAYQLLYPIQSEHRTWVEGLIEKHPTDYGTVLGKIWRIQVARGEQSNVQGDYVSKKDGVKAKVIVREMTGYLIEETALPYKILKGMVTTVLRFGDHAELVALYPKALTNKKVRKDQKAIWLALATFFAQGEYLSELEKWVRERSRYTHIAYEVLTAGCFNCDVEAEQVLQIKTALWLLGRYFNVVEEIGGTGRSGLQDVSRDLKNLIERLSNIPTQEAQGAFQELIAEKGLWQWRAHLRHAQAVQLKKMRDSHFAAPKAEAISMLLAGGASVNMADFQAFTLDVLDEIHAYIRGDNTNAWKQFWRLQAKGILDSPRIENDCRDVLLPLMRPYLSVRNISVEPEASAADEKRVDIRLTQSPTATLPIEIKRDDNTELWTAMKDQLQKQYMNDPKTGGYGVFLVLWFGTTGNELKSPPKELRINKPTTADELQLALMSICPDPKIAVRVVDVTQPHGSSN